MTVRKDGGRSGGPQGIGFDRAGDDKMGLSLFQSWDGAHTERG